MLLGARQFFERRGAPAWRNPYVTDGLIAMWDGEWNAGGGVHDEKLRCIELTGKSGDVSFVGDVVRLQSNDGFNINSQGLSLSDGAGYGVADTLLDSYVSDVSTIQICVEFPAKYNNWEGVIRYNVSDIGLNGVYKYWYHKNGNRSASLASAAGGFDIVGQKTVATFIFTVGQSLPVVYFGDTQSDTVGVNGNYTYNRYSQVLIGAGYETPLSNLKPCKMIFRSARVYSRALTANEIAANYAIDKARFNLP